MLLMLDDMPFTTAVQIIKYCHSHEIDPERSSLYYNKITSKPVDFDKSGEPWVLEVPENLLTFFRMKYGGLE